MHDTYCALHDCCKSDFAAVVNTTAFRDVRVVMRDAPRPFVATGVRAAVLERTALRDGDDALRVVLVLAVFLERAVVVRAAPVVAARETAERSTAVRAAVRSDTVRAADVAVRAVDVAVRAVRVLVRERSVSTVRPSERAVAP